MKHVTSLLMLAMLLSLALWSAALAADRFVNNKDGTVTDTQSGLMWADKDNGFNVNWFAAKSYCEGFTGGGKSGWRLPTLAELAQLYSAGVYGSVIKRVKSYLWASNIKNGRAGCFRFTSGIEEYIGQYYSGDRLGVLPVRNTN